MGSKFKFMDSKKTPWHTLITVKHKIYMILFTLHCDPKMSFIHLITLNTTSKFLSSSIVSTKFTK